MNFRTTLILIALLAVIIGYLAWDRTRPPPVAAGPVRILPDLTGIDVRGFAISSPAGARVSVLLDDRSQWIVSTPDQPQTTFPADPTAIDSFVATLLALESSATPTTAQTAAFTPATTLSLSLTRGRTAEVAVAAPNPVGETLASVRIADRQRWHLVAPTVAGALSKGPADFRQSRFVVVGPPDIGLVTLEFDNQWVRLTRDTDGWGLDHGDGAAPALRADIPRGSTRADAQVVRDLLAALTSARAEELVANPGPNAFALPQLVIHYTQFGATTQPLPGVPGHRTVRLGRFEDARRERIVVNSDTPPVTGYAPTSVLTTLRKSHLDLRDKLVLRLSSADITGLTLERENTPTQTVTLDSSTTPPIWTLTSDAGTTPDREKLTLILAELSTLRASRFLPPSATTQLSTPTTLRIKTAAGDTVLQLGPDALRTADVAFESPTDLWELTRTGFLPAPTTQPATQPAP